MLLTVNGNNDDDDGEEDRWTSPPSSFPVDALLQSTEWLGLGLSNRLGEAKWLDVGGDSISIQVQPRPSPAKQGGGCTPSSSRGGGGGGGVFVSIPAEAVATSSKVLVSMRSLQVEVSLSECPALTRLVCIPPSQTRAGARCTIVVQLQGGAKVFGRFRKAVAALTSKVARKPKERCSLASFQRNASASSRVEMQARSASRDSTVVAPTLRPAPATPAAAPPAAPTSGEVRDTPRKEEARIAGDKAEDGEDWKQPAATSGRHARNTRRAALVTPSEDAAGPAPAAAVSATVGNSRSSSSASSTGERNKKRRLVAGDSHFETVDATPAATGKASRGVDDGAAGSATITVGSIGSIRRIAEGTSIARSLRASHDAPGGGANVAAAAAADENDGDSWMEPRRHLDLAPAAAAAAATAKEKRRNTGANSNNNRTSGSQAARGARGGSCSGGGQVESGKAEGCGGTGQERGSAHGGGGRGGRSASSARGDGASERSGAGDIVPRGAGGRPPRREAALKAMQALSPVSSKSSQSSQSSSQGEGNDVGGRAGRSDIAARGTETPSEKSCFSIRGDDHDDDCDDRDNDEEEEEWDEAIVPAAESTAAADRAAALSTAKGKRPARGEGQRSGVAWDEGDSIPSASLGARAEGGTATSKHGYDQKGEESLEEPAQNSVEYSDEELSERSDGVVGGGRGTGAGGARGSGGGVLVSDGGDGNNDGGGGEEAGEEPGSEDVWEDYDHNDDEDEVEADEDEEDSIMLAQLYQQLVATSRAKAKRQKKRKAESSVGGARAECRDYLDRTAQKVKEHWRRQAHSLLEEARQAEEAVASAREVVKSLAAQHEAQWQATRGRMQKHASSLKRLEAQLSSGQDGPDAKMSELESEWQGGAEELQQKLQKHREAAVTRFSATITSNKKARKGQRGDAGAGGDNMATLLSHLTMRRTK
ncbi:unnamed protein product [Scytosiphon promiscuus]